ncbi:MAG: hypothetical protein CL489_08550 [Acidobacteria bacterium]|nr:hypothetical protein [Acidobacteriota bacterium]|tara:strand:- start:42908 stop:43219 length:312 start_codon:yes stop_codon:yes gene_type:complete
MVKFKPDANKTTVNGIKRQVVCAANKYPCGTIVLGVRHFCPLMRQNIKAHGIKPTQMDMIQGFVDQWGNFMDREEALAVVKANGRFMRDTGFHSRELFTENCY